MLLNQLNNLYVYYAIYWKKEFLYLKYSLVLIYLLQQLYINTNNYKYVSCHSVHSMKTKFM